jgi:hypothetical protein
MKIKTQILVFGIFLSIVVGISGYFYLNPEFIVTGKLFDGRNHGYYNYTHFKYSILISVVVGILLLTFMTFFSKKK